MYRILFILVLTAGLFLSCSQKQLKSGINKEHFDTSVRPQDDFYRYVNGTWLKNAEIPADRSSWGAFHKMREDAQKNLRAIIEESAALENKIDGTDEQKTGDFYLSFMDSARIEELGIKPLEQELNKINSAGTKSDLQKLMSRFLVVGVPVPFYYFINQDQKQSDQYIGYLYQSGLGMPDRDYYLQDNAKFKEIRGKYLKYIEDLFILAGIEHGASAAKKIMKLETKMAKAHWTRVENRDRDKTYNKFKLADLANETHGFNWAGFLSDAGVKNVDEIVVYQPSFFKELGRLYKKVSAADWKTYYTYKLLSSSAPLLSSDFVKLNFDFYSKTLRGVQQMRPRWKRGVSTVNGALGEVVGKVYVKKHFKPEAKKRMVDLVNNLQKSFAKRIEQLDWMGPDTKKEALKKLAKFKAKIGYPDKWKDYSSLVVKHDDLIGNMVRSNTTDFQREIAKLGKPIDREEWHMSPQTVNAYYNPPMNEVVFPAAILQPPFFNLEADDAVNYGAIGYVIGHEMTHGFDDQGRKSDGEGNLVEWWTEEDEKKFMERAEVMVEQYNQYTPVDSMHLNGRLTLGENIADLGGLVISYYAYQMSLEGREAPVIDGFTGNERFFLGIAQVTQSKMRDEAMRQRILTDPHSPGEYRCNGVVSNMPEFYETYGVKEGDGMYRAEDVRVNIW